MYEFCCEHKRMVCSSCSSNHTNCTVQIIEDVCKNTSPSEPDSLYDRVKDLQEQARSVLLTVKTNITCKKPKEERKSILAETHNLYDQIISRMNKLYQDMQSDIEAKCQSQNIANVSAAREINGIIAKLDSFMTDIENFQGKPIDTKLRKIKLFSPAMKILSSVSVPDKLWDIAVTSDSEAAATTTNKSLVLLDISGSQLRIKTTTKVPYDIIGITKYNNKLVISSTSPTTVELIDLTGKVYWSVSSDQQGQSLFRYPWYLTSHDEGRSSTVIVTDLGNNTLTLLNGETGEVITRRQLQGKGPTGVTTDTAGNVFVCYCSTDEVSVLSGDLSEEKILLSRHDGLSYNPRAIVYDDKTHRLHISYDSNDIVDSFKLS